MERPSRLFTLLLLCLSGCSSAETLESSGTGPTATTGELTVIVWSAHLQRPVPASGAIIPVDDPTRQDSFDTRSDPAHGQTVILRPGQYQVSVRFRYLPTTGVQTVHGEEVVYMEPGAKNTLRVVVTDHKDDIGLRPQAPLTSPAVSIPPLPLGSVPG